MLDFCAEHGIVSDIEMIPIQKINEAYERLLKRRRQVPLRDRHGLAQGRSGLSGATAQRYAAAWMP